MSDKARVLVLGSLPPPVNGATVYFDTLLKTKAAKDLRITFMNFRFADTIGDYGRFSLSKALLLVRYVIRLLIVLCTQPIGVVYAAMSFNRTSFAKDIFLVAICRLFGKRVVGGILGTGLQELYDSSGRRMQRSIRWCLRLYAAFVSPSRAMYETYFAGLLPLDKERTVPFGIFTDAVSPTRRLLGSTDQVRLIYYSNFIKSKGIDDLIEAIPLVVQANPNVRFRFVGAWDSEAHRKLVMDLVAAAEISQWVEFRGVATGDERKQCLQDSDIFVLPTYYRVEGLPLSILEAMSHGCAIVATNHAGIPTAVEDGVNGFFCKPQNPRNLAETINRLLDDRELLWKMQQNSIVKFQENFTAEHFGANLARELSMESKEDR
jgi:glycosyltransferase involved in cell wall biosynthesis